VAEKYDKIGEKKRTSTIDELCAGHVRAPIAALASRAARALPSPPAWSTPSTYCLEYPACAEYPCLSVRSGARRSGALPRSTVPENVARSHTHTHTPHAHSHARTLARTHARTHTRTHTHRQRACVRRCSPRRSRSTSSTAAGWSTRRTQVGSARLGSARLGPARLGSARLAGLRFGAGVGPFAWAIHPSAAVRPRGLAVDLLRRSLPF
jgi:hypothetical protein